MKYYCTEISMYLLVSLGVAVKNFPKCFFNIYNPISILYMGREQSISNNSTCCHAEVFETLILNPLK